MLLVAIGASGKSAAFPASRRPHALAARAMRQVLVDHARRKLAGKRLGEQVELEENVALSKQQSEEVLAIHEAPERLQELDLRQARIVKMHYFAGNAVEEVASALESESGR